MPAITTFDAAREHLFGLRNRGSKYGIGRMRRLAELLGDPHSRVPCVHVAGTNGKGSVCAMLESVYRRAGLKTGLFTSPHLVHLGERVQVDRRPLGESAITGYTAEIAAVVAGHDWDGDPPSFFEWMTAMALTHFARQECDIVLLETGLGGRLDATNIVRPELSLITSIGLDHTDILGATLAAIAVEKAGIIKPGTPVAAGRLPAEARAVVTAAARERCSPLHWVGDRFPDFDALPRTALAGAFQRWNAGLATLAVDLLGDRFPVKAADLEAGLLAVEWPGRWQTMRLDGRTLILDATHNAEGARELDRNLGELRRATGARPEIIVGTVGTERAPALLEVVARHAARIHLVAPSQPRAVTPEDLATLLPEDAPPAEGSALGQLFPAPGKCVAGRPGSTVVLCGSLYLVGEAMARIEGGGDASALQDLP